MASLDFTNRFSNRVENYQKFRPSYPETLYNFLAKEISLVQSAKIIDLGSGTGLLSDLFLKHGHPLWGIEPNLKMRTAAEAYLSNYKDFISLDGTAESIPLPDQCADLVIAGQAFHWFDPQKSRIEVKRILKTNANVALIWNDWTPDLSPFQKEYDALLIQFGTDYKKISRLHGNNQENIQLFFKPNIFREQTFPNAQLFDFEGIQGRLLSSSYAPLKHHPNHAPMLSALVKLFNNYEQNGQINFGYNTRLYFASLDL